MTLLHQLQVVPQPVPHGAAIRADRLSVDVEQHQFAGLRIDQVPRVPKKRVRAGLPAELAEFSLRHTDSGHANGREFPAWLSVDQSFTQTYRRKS